MPLLINHQYSVHLLQSQNTKEKATEFEKTAMSHSQMRVHARSRLLKNQHCSPASLPLNTKKKQTNLSADTTNILEFCSFKCLLQLWKCVSYFSLHYEIILIGIWFWLFESKWPHHFLQSCIHFQGLATTETPNINLGLNNLIYYKQLLVFQVWGNLSVGQLLFLDHTCWPVTRKYHSKWSCFVKPTPSMVVLSVPG